MRMINTMNISGELEHLFGSQDASLDDYSDVDLGGYDEYRDNELSRQ